MRPDHTSSKPGYKICNSGRFEVTVQVNILAGCQFYSGGVEQNCYDADNCNGKQIADLMAYNQPVDLHEIGHVERLPKLTTLGRQSQKPALFSGFSN